MFLLKLKQKETVERLTDLNLKKEMNEENGWDCLMFKKKGGGGVTDRAGEAQWG